jgi:DNA-directed RNA polymerase specialized sigma24 family protein
MDPLNAASDFISGTERKSSEPGGLVIDAKLSRIVSKGGEVMFRCPLDLMAETEWGKDGRTDVVRAPLLRRDDDLRLLVQDEIVDVGEAGIAVTGIEVRRPDPDFRRFRYRYLHREASDEYRKFLRRVCRGVFKGFRDDHIESISERVEDRLNDRGMAVARDILGIPRNCALTDDQKKEVERLLKEQAVGFDWSRPEMFWSWVRRIARSLRVDVLRKARCHLRLGEGKGATYLYPGRIVTTVSGSETGQRRARTANVRIIVRESVEGHPPDVLLSVAPCCEIRWSFRASAKNLPGFSTLTIATKSVVVKNAVEDVREIPVRIGSRLELDIVEEHLYLPPSVGREEARERLGGVLEEFLEDPQDRLLILMRYRGRSYRDISCVLSGTSSPQHENNLAQKCKRLLAHIRGKLKVESQEKPRTDRP